MEPILTLAEKEDLFVIEDCAQAHGATYKGRPVGGIGDVGAWSFCQDKIMTTGGEGGMVTTNNKSLWEKMWAYKDHGKSYEAVYHTDHPPGFRWLHTSFGTNWRMTEMQAAIGRIQLKYMPVWRQLRQQNASVIANTCHAIKALRVPQITENIEHAFYKFYVFVNLERLKPRWSRDRIVETMIKIGVPCFQGSCSEIYLEKAFDGEVYRPLERLPVAKLLGETSLMFLVHPTMRENDIERTCIAIEQVMSEASC